MKAKDGSFSMIYLPVGNTVTVNTSALAGNTLKYWWFNPRDGKSRLGGTESRKAKMVFTPPTFGLEEDWVLVIDDVSKNYPTPGSH